jgi:hypothetical protein
MNIENDNFYFTLNLDSIKINTFKNLVLYFT